MNADELRAVAAEIRAKAKAATPGPWIQDEWSVIEAGYESEVAHLDGHFRVADKNGPHIVAWHPTVALAVADWLDAEAARSEHPFGPTGEAIAFVKVWRGES